MMTFRFALILLIAALPLRAADLTLVRSFTYPGPSGLAFDSRFCALWVANETAEIALITLWGEELRRFSTDLRRVDAIAMEGGTLLLTDGSGSYQRADIDGRLLGAPFRIGAGQRDNDGLFVAADGAIWIADDGRSSVERLGDGGWQIDGTTLSPPLLEPQGISIDPVSGHVLVVDDADASDSLFEFTADGRLLDVIALPWDGVGDAEAITVQPGTGTVFIGFDDTDTIGVYDFTATKVPGAEAAARQDGCALARLSTPVRRG